MNRFRTEISWIIETAKLKEDHYSVSYLIYLKLTTIEEIISQHKTLQRLIALIQNEFNMPFYTILRSQNTQSNTA